MASWSTRQAQPLLLCIFQQTNPSAFEPKVQDILSWFVDTTPVIYVTCLQWCMLTMLQLQQQRHCCIRICSDLKAKEQIMQQQMGRGMLYSILVGT